MGVQRRMVGLALAAALAVGTLGCSSDGSDGAADDGGGGSGVTTTTAEFTGDGGTEGTVPPTVEVVIPDGFPSELVPPDAVTLTAANAVGETGFTLQGTAAGADLQALYDGLQAQLTDGGYEIVGTSFTEDDEGGAFGSVSATGSEYTVAVSFGPDDTTQTDDTYAITMNVGAVGG